MDSEKELTATETTISGAKTCQQCHQKVYADYLKDPHTHTSWPVTTDEVVKGGNPKVAEFPLNDHLKIVVEKRKDGMYQVPYYHGSEGLPRRFDIAVGSGKHAHTYGFWTGDKLTQLQLTYFRNINEWTNSPGYPSRIYFQGMGKRCLECHTSYAEVTSVQTSSLSMEDSFNRKSIIYGIDCERCHGPAGKHVEFHIKNPENKSAKYIKLYKDLTRKQKIDACAVCHSGNDVEELKSSFAFKPGDDIAEYYHYNPGSFASSEPDVHGNQIGMLQGSQCFAKSKDMTCGTCHSAHKAEDNNLIAYSKQCISCHATIKHSEKTLGNAMVKTNCINCHMPLKSSKVITYQQAGQKEKSAYQLHTHRIAVY
ncbi:MAG TPA: cytochrome c3 family protein [Pedobacter sp.]|nr:cytochrome c3 family protein [Pedobacter sp.]